MEERPKNTETWPLESVPGELPFIPRAKRKGSAFHVLFLIFFFAWVSLLYLFIPRFFPKEKKSF